MSWIKARTNLRNDPKVIAAARYLASDEAFCTWLWGNDECNIRNGERNERVTQVVTRITESALLDIWGKMNATLSNDGISPVMVLCDIDALAQVPSLGKAMESVGWVVELEDGGGLQFPNFEEHNSPERERRPKTNAERQQKYRDKKKEEKRQQEEAQKRSVTERNESNGRVDKRRVDKIREEKELSAQARKDSLSPSDASHRTALGIATDPRLAQFLEQLAAHFGKKDAAQIHVHQRRLLHDYWINGGDPTDEQTGTLLRWLREADREKEMLPRSAESVCEHLGKYLDAARMWAKANPSATTVVPPEILAMRKRKKAAAQAKQQQEEVPA